MTGISRLTREIVDNSDDGMLVIDFDDRIVFTNQNAVDLLGHKEIGSVINKTVDEVLRRESDAELRELLLEHAPALTEIDYIRCKDERMALEVSVRPMGKRHTRDFARAVFLKDLTERRRVERVETLTEQLRGIQEMAAAIAHEVRNPLASIKASVQELVRLTFTSDEDSRLLKIVCRETDRLDKIIGDFLQFAGLRPPKMRTCDISAILDDVAELLLARTAEKPFELIRRYDKGLTCTADNQQMMQVLLNIAINAFDAINPGGRITFEAQQRLRNERNGDGERRRFSGWDKLVITISDDGPGIPGDIMDKIFAPFFTTKEKGVGMGLAIVNRICQQHDIELDVRSAPGEGTAFTMKIDISQSAKSDDTRTIRVKRTTRVLAAR